MGRDISFETTFNRWELTLARYLDNNLPVEWEIYLQPYLNGDRPDIVIMNPNVGMMIIEVKDYKYGPYFSKLAWFIKWICS